MLAPGQIVDRYEVLAELGEGGMATVYRVRHTTLGSQHALKVLQPTIAGVAERLLNEGRVQAGLDHPNALTVTDVIDVNGSPGLVMELVEGGTLLDWLERDPPRDERLAVFRQVCEAVAAAHALGWVHRDLKPANILMKQVGDRWSPKVADFGLVKTVLGDRPRGGPRTRDGVAMGTPGYMAPEQIADAAAVDARADVYSLGCILIHTLTGDPPFEGEMLDVFAAVAAGAHRTLPPSDPLYALAERCLARDASARPADAGELLDALDAPPSRAPVAAAGVPVAPAFGALSAVVVGALSLGCACGGLLLGTTLLPGSEASLPPVRIPSISRATTDCPLSGEKVRIGYTLAKSGPLQLNDTFVLVEPGAVLARPGDAEPRCTLPAGARLTMRERPRAPRTDPGSLWLPVFADAVELP